MNLINFIDLSKSTIKEALIYDGKDSKKVERYRYINISAISYYNVLISNIIDERIKQELEEHLKEISCYLSIDIDRLPQDATDIEHLDSCVLALKNDIIKLFYTCEILRDIRANILVLLPKHLSISFI